MQKIKRNKMTSGWQLLTLAAITAVLAVGCDKKNESASIETTTTTTSSDNTGPLAPASRETRSSSRVYASNNPSSTKEADNTGKNVRDRDDATLTPGDQGSSDADRELTRRIRRELTSNDQFSTTAKNIKIITTNGKVTLRGPVNNAQEQQAVMDLAKKAAGSAEVENQLEPKTSP